MRSSTAPSSSRLSEQPRRALDRRAPVGAARPRLRMALARRQLGRRVARARPRPRAGAPQPAAVRARPPRRRSRRGDRRRAQGSNRLPPSARLRPARRDPALVIVSLRARDRELRLRDRALRARAARGAGLPPPRGRDRVLAPLPRRAPAARRRRRCGDRGRYSSSTARSRPATIRRTAATRLMKMPMPRPAVP